MHSDWRLGYFDFHYGGNCTYISVVELHMTLWNYLHQTNLAFHSCHLFPISLTHSSCSVSGTSKSHFYFLVLLKMNKIYVRLSHQIPVIHHIKSSQLATHGYSKTTCFFPWRKEMHITGYKWGPFHHSMWITHHLPKRPNAKTLTALRNAYFRCVMPHFVSSEWVCREGKRQGKWCFNAE